MAPIIAYLALTLATVLSRISVARAISARGIEFGLGTGPALFRFPWNGGACVLRLIPLGDYAKMPEHSDESSEGDGHPPIPVWKQHAINSVSLVVPAIAYLILLPWWHDPFIDVLGSIGRELGSGLLLAENHLWFSRWSEIDLTTAAQHILIASLVLNAVPLPQSCLGFALGLPEKKWLKDGPVAPISLLVYLFLIVLVIGVVLF
jgi:hypothetical protein